MQKSTLNSYQYSNNRQYCALECEKDAGRLYDKGYKKERKRQKTYLIDVQFFTDKMLATQDHQTLQNSDEKQYCLYWILCLVVFN